MFELVSKSRQSECCFWDTQEEQSSIVHVSTVCLTECQTGHGQQTTDDSDCQWWRQVNRAQTGIQEPSCADICTPGQGTHSLNWIRSVTSSQRRTWCRKWISPRSYLPLTDYPVRWKGFTLPSIYPSIPSVPHFVNLGNSRFWGFS